MIREYEAADLGDVKRIWLDAHIRNSGHVSTDIYLSGTSYIENFITETDSYVLERGGHVCAFVQIIGEQILGLYSDFDKHLRKNLAKLIKFVRKETGSKHIIFHAFIKSDEALNIYRQYGFTLTGSDINEKTGDEELLLEWKK